jgi:serine/threonine protein kinase
MRVCSRCGESYPDGVVACPIDGGRLRAAGSGRRDVVFGETARSAGAATASAAPGGQVSAASMAAAQLEEPTLVRAHAPRLVAMPRTASPPRMETAPWPPPRGRGRNHADQRAEGTIAPPVGPLAEGSAGTTSPPALGLPPPALPPSPSPPPNAAPPPTAAASAASPAPRTAAPTAPPPRASSAAPVTRAASPSANQRASSETAAPPRRHITEPQRPVALRADTSPVTGDAVPTRSRPPSGPAPTNGASPAARERTRPQAVDPNDSSGVQRARVLGGRYRLERKIAEGGFGTVYSAEDTRLSKRVAVKVLSPLVSSDKEHLERFCREAVAASMIGHEGIVNVTDFDRDADGTPFIVMELLDGSDLARVIETDGALPVSRALAIAIQIASALDGAHQSGVLHRDLKPANVFLIQRGNRRDVVKIVDFGISKVLDPRFGRSSITLNGQVVGTPYYMAPEQAQGHTDLDARVDIYALGVIVYEMLVGEPPLTGADYLAAALNRPGAGVQPPSARRAGLWPGLDQLVLKALSRDRDQRHASMAIFGAALLRELESIDPVSATLLGAHPSWVVTDRDPGAGDLFGGVTVPIPEANIVLARGTAKSERALPPITVDTAPHPGVRAGSSLDPYDAETVNGRPTPHSVAALADTQAVPVLPLPRLPSSVPLVSAGPPARGPAVIARPFVDPRAEARMEARIDARTESIDDDPEIEIHRAPAEPEAGVGTRRGDEWRHRIPNLPADAQRLAPRLSARRSRWPRALFILAAILFVCGAAVTLAGDRAVRPSDTRAPTSTPATD